MAALKVSSLGGAFMAGARARAAFQYSTFMGLASPLTREAGSAVSRYAMRSARPAMIRGAMVGGGLGAFSAVNSDRRNGSLGLGTPIHMMWGGFTGALKGGALGGLGGVAFGTRAARSSEALRQYSLGGF